MQPHFSSQFLIMRFARGLFENNNFYEVSLFAQFPSHVKLDAPSERWHP